MLRLVDNNRYAPKDKEISLEDNKAAANANARTAIPSPGSLCWPRTLIYSCKNVMQAVASLTVV